MADATNETPTTNGTSGVGWMSDVQRALALLLIGTVAFMVIVLTLRIAVSGDLPTIAALLKELKDALTNMSLIALGFFFGSNMSKLLADAGQQKIVEKLTGTPSPPGPGGPVAPVPQTVVVMAWWGLLTKEEQDAITEAGKTDSLIAKFIVTAGIGKAAPDDLAYLVSKNLLSPERAKQIEAS